LPIFNQKHFPIMLTVHAFTFNPFQENTYLLSNEHKDCWIIDPGMYGADEDGILFNFIAEQGLKPVQIINTHAHIDHIMGIESVQAKYNIPFGMHTLEQPVLANAKGSAMLFGFTFGSVPTPDFFIAENETLQLGDDTLEVRLAPGHSPGSIVFYNAAGKWLIGGDVLFNGSEAARTCPAAIMMYS